MTTDVGVPAPEAGNNAGTHPASTRSTAVQPWQDPWRLAQRLANTSWVPKPFRGKPEEVVGAILYGMELGIGPITSLKSIQLIDGVPTASASLMRGLILRQGHVMSWRHVSPEKVIVYGRRRDTGSESTVIWTIQQAKDAKLTNKGVWQQYPMAMLVARATSQLARTIFDDVLHGLIYTPEEMGAAAPPIDFIDIDELDIEPEGELDEGVSQDSGEAGEPRSPAEPEQSGEGDIGTLDTPSPDIPLPLDGSDE